MARKPRQEVVDGIHHVFARGNAKGLIYRGDDDRREYLTTLRLTIKRTRWRCLAYCLMDNHMHLLIQTPEPNLGAGMQRLHGLYGRLFNDRHGRSGHVFQGRFKSKLVTNDEQLWTTARYIARNPVEAGLCKHAHDWPWSSHALMTRGTAPPWVDWGRLLSYFSSDGGDPWKRYRALVDAELQP
ncbi:MAG TPA: transposase [Solirubrobacter sp.]|jgi:REP element-mobilizing transposase RayT|nr:transposase [Solirubrobacter sp.]